MNDEKTEASVSFVDLDLAPEVLHAVRDAGYTHPTPIQQQAIPVALAGRDLIGLAQTGTGKTAGFTLPIVQNLITTPLAGADGEPLHRPRVLILTPTRELAAQVEASFRKYGKYTSLRVVPIYGGVGIEPQSKALRRGVDVVVATPGRLLDHMERGNVGFDDLEVLVLDDDMARIRYFAEYDLRDETPIDLHSILRHHVVETAPDSYGWHIHYNEAAVFRGLPIV